ncbi:MAG: L-asparaginase / beta-aspartyl-peptidase [Blastocatellia bacterium]|jgi:beta-aspartyl-peptidase (threonine type)|nr:L-asparaginase / beta-aspartyl-peptidase [Blastocatellia bacterium]
MNSKTKDDAKLALAIQGGAGTILRAVMNAEREAAYREGLQRALLGGWQVLQDGGAALDAVERAVCVFEDNPLFNAGRGAVFTHDEQHEMDAAIMSGKDLRAGAVAAVGGVKNPIMLARRVMEETEHVLLCGSGAEEFARAAGCEFESPEYFFDQFRHEQFLEARRANEVRMDHTPVSKIGTVGAVARDAEGHLAAATSTGGMTNKRFGRIGDTAIIGAGTYADDRTCAVSCTGHGEYFMRAVVAYDVACLMKYKGLTLKDACEQVVNVRLREMGAEGGLVAVDSAGNVALPFNSEGMYRAWITSESAAQVDIYGD